jgi:hypothetical protein
MGVPYAQPRRLKLDQPKWLDLDNPEQRRRFFEDER